MNRQTDVLILGYGEMGRALQTLLEPFHKLSIWNRSSVEGQTFCALNECAPQAKIIIFCLPVNAHLSLLEEILPMMNEKALCVSIAKGLDESGKSAEEIFKTRLDRYSLIYGPMISEEICANKVGFAQFGCSKKTDYNVILEIFKSTNLYLNPTDDVTGISWSVILKNVYALAFGMMDELDMGKNVRGFLTVMALNELDSIAESLGANAKSSYGLAGLGDLITTGSSEDSRHHSLGRRVAKGDFSNMKAEGTHTLLMVKKFNHFEWRRYPLFMAIEKIISQELKAKEALEALYVR